VDTEVRCTRRNAFLLALAESGVDLHICGDGWEPHLHRFKSATYHGPVDMARMVELMRQSRVVLNTNGNFGAGSHERPFSAALAGATTFSDYSRYYAAEFEPGENIELFSWMDLPGAMDRLRALSADPERCWRLGRSAKQLTLARHTWDRRVPDILAAAGLTAAIQ
jgi:spore maturation protein CgeB